MSEIPAGLTPVDAIYSRPLRPGEQPWPIDPEDGTTPDWRRCDLCEQDFKDDVWDCKPIRQFFADAEGGLTVCEHCIGEWIKMETVNVD